MSVVNFDSINNKLNHLENVKADIKNTLVNKGEVITSGTPFSNYVSSIDSLTNTYDSNINSASIWGDNSYAWANNERVYGTMQNGECANRDILNYKLNIFDNYPEVNITKAYGINYSPMFDKKVLPVINLGNITNVAYPIINYNTEVVLGVKSGAITTGAIKNIFIRASNLKYVDLNGLNLERYSYVFGIESLFTPLKRDCYVANLDMLNTINIRNMNSVFANCRITSDINTILNWDVSNATNLSDLVYGARMPGIGFNLIRNGDINTSASGLFQNSRISTVNLTRFNLNGISSLGSMFNNTIIASTSTSEASLNIANLDLSSVNDISRMFSYCEIYPSTGILTKVVDGELKNVENIESAYGFLSSCDDALYRIVNNCYFKNLSVADSMFAGGKLTNNCSNITFGSNITQAVRMFDNSKMRVEGSINLDLYNCINAQYMFSNYISNCAIFVYNLSNLQDGTSMFENLKGANTVMGSLYVNGYNDWDFGNLTYANNMFRNSSILYTQSINITNINKLNSKNCDNMFKDMRCKADSSTLSVNIKDSTSMLSVGAMLQGAPVGTLTVSNSCLSSLFFYNAYTLKYINIVNCDTANITGIQLQNNPQLYGVILTNCNMENLSGIAVVDCPMLYNFKIDTTNSHLKSINFMNSGIDDNTISNLNNWDISNVTKMENTFRACRNINILQWSDKDLSNCTNLLNTFRSTGLRSFEWSNISAPNANIQNLLTGSMYITDVKIANCNFENSTGRADEFIGGYLGLFEDNERLRLKTYINITIENTSVGIYPWRICPAGNVVRQINIDNMISNNGCSTIINGNIINHISISNIQSRNDFYFNISNTSNLDTLIYKDIDGSNTVGNLNAFTIRNTPNLKFVNISNIDLSNIESIKLNLGNTGNAYVQLSNWNICNCINCDNMFYGLRASNLMIDNWNTRSLQNMSAMFSNVSGLTDEAIDSIINMCINSVNVISKNLFYMNTDSPFYGSGIQNTRYQNRWSDLTNAGWTY